MFAATEICAHKSISTETCKPKDFEFWKTVMKVRTKFLGLMDGVWFGGSQMKS